MNNDLELDLVVENNIDQFGLTAEHGLGFWIDYKGQNYLFDTGQGQALMNNLKELDLAIDDLSGVILSHGHYDHAGGLKDVLGQNPDLLVYAHPDIFHAKYSKKSSRMVFRGFDLAKEEINDFKSVRELIEIESGLWLTGEVPRKNEVEKLNDHYQIKVNDEFKIDSFKDEQSLILETEQGLVVLLGCSHAGVINILDYITANFTQNIYAIIGGMHLVNANQERIEWTVDRLAEIEFELLIPLHCTGERAVDEMKDAFGDKVQYEVKLNL